MKQSNWEKLIQAIETEMYVIGIKNLINPEKYDSVWVMGYYSALKEILDKAKEIKRG